MSYIKLCYVYVTFKRTSQSCLPSKISQSINVENNQLILNGALLIEMVSNSFSENKKLWLSDKARNVLVENK